MGKHSITLIQDQKQNFGAVVNFLKSEGYRVNSISLTEEMDLLASLDARKTDLVLLPVDLKQNNGIDFCYKLKSSNVGKHLFVILISKQKEDYSLIAGLDSGADDFLFQPLHERVLLCRIKALLKRKLYSSIEEKEQGLFIDHERYLIIADGKECYLPKKEFEILSLLYSRPTKVFTREEIKNAVWENFDKVRGRTVDVHIKKIREKIGESLIATVKGVGYRLEV